MSRFVFLSRLWNRPLDSSFVDYLVQCRCPPAITRATRIFNVPQRLPIDSPIHVAMTLTNRYCYLFQWEDSPFGFLLNNCIMKVPTTRNVSERIPQQQQQYMWIANILNIKHFNRVEGEEFQEQWFISPNDNNDYWIFSMVFWELRWGSVVLPLTANNFTWICDKAQKTIIHKMKNKKNPLLC